MSGRKRRRRPADMDSDSDMLISRRGDMLHHDKYNNEIMVLKERIGDADRKLESRK